MKREFVKDHVNLDERSFNGTADQIYEVLKGIERDLGDNGRKNIHFKWYGEYDYQVVQVHFLRPETDEEMRKREKSLKKKLEKLERDKEKRHELYLELKKEFEE